MDISEALARGPVKIGSIGDSRVVRCGQKVITAGQGYTSDHYNNGYAGWAQSALKGRAVFPAELCFGVSGETSTQILARVPAALTTMIAAGCRIVTMYGNTTNDRTSTTPVMTAADSIANLTQMFALAVAAGLRVIYFAETPRGNASFPAQRLTSPQLDYHRQVYRWAVDVASKIPGVTVIDLWAEFVDPTTTSDSKATVTIDGLHQNQLSGRIGGERLASVLLPTLPSRQFAYATDAGDAYSADNRRGNMAPNGMLSGTGGTKPAGITGTVADSTVATLATAWTAGTITCLGAQVTDADGFPWQQFTLGGNSASNVGPSMLLEQVVPVANIQAGDVLQAALRIQADAGMTGVRAMYVETYVRSAGSIIQTRSMRNFSSNGTLLPAITYTGDNEILCISPESVIFAGETLTQAFIRIRLEVIESAPISAVVRFGGLGLRKIN